MKIIDCKVNHIINPIGYRMEHVVFSWKVENAQGEFQKAAHIIVAKDIEFSDVVWETEDNSILDSVACEATFILEPRTRYYWKIKVVSDMDEEAESDICFFETAKREEKWTANWIGCQPNEEGHPIFSKKVVLKDKPTNARLYICGLGLYEVYVNEQKIGNEYLTPYCNDYNEWLQYQTYDITDLLEVESELSVWLGNGWYKGRFSFSPEDHSGKYGNEFALIAELHIDYPDGTHEIIITDESWDVYRNNIIFSGIYDGEHRDDTLEFANEEKSIILEYDYERLTERMSIPVKSYKEWNPIEIIETPNGDTILDLGQNFAGIFRMKVNEPKGTEVVLQFGEILQNGEFFRDNLRTAKAEYKYISNGEEVILEPHFTFYGYRYVKVIGVSNVIKENFTAVALASDLQSTGYFFTHNKKINQLLSNVWWGMRSNMVDVPTDCPQRDERLGWTGDAQVFSETACLFADMYAFYTKYLYDMKMEQSTLNGRIPDYIPSRGEGNTSSVWGDAACIIPWNLYRIYGDKSILIDQYESMKSWVEYIRTIDGENHNWGNVFHYGDWLALDNETGDPNENSGATDVAYIAYIYYMNSADILSKSAEVLHKEEDVLFYKKLSEEIRTFIKHMFFTGSGRCAINTQTALILALKYSLAEDVEWTKHRLWELFFNKKDKLLTGFVGTPLTCSVLSENGMVDLAYKLLLNEDYPGWLYAVNLGATTIWERWDSVLPDGTLSGTGMNSLNHYAYGSIAQWIYEYVGGIRQCEDSIGYRKVIIAPILNWKMKEIQMSFDSPIGKYCCEWKILDETHVDLKVSVPFGGQALLTIPEGDISGGLLRAGDYHYVYETKCSLRKHINCQNSLRDLLENHEIKEYLLEKFPQIAMIKYSLQYKTLEELLMTFAGYVGLPDRKTMREIIIPELNKELEKYE